MSIRVTITDNITKAIATGPVTYTFTFSEDITVFDESKITITGGSRGSFNRVSSSEWTVVVTPPTNNFGNIIVKTDAGAGTSTITTGTGPSAITTTERSLAAADSVQAYETQETDQTALAARDAANSRLRSLIPEDAGRDALVFGAGSIDFSSIGEYPFLVNRQISNVSDKTSLTFGLDSTKKMVLGDNTSITFLNGINLAVTLSLLDSAKSSTNAERTKISFDGIAQTVKIGARELDALQLDTVHPNKIYLPILNELVLSYGNINTANKQRLFGVEFMRPDNKSKTEITFDDDYYANFKLISSDAVDKNQLSSASLEQTWQSADPDMTKYLMEKNLFKGVGSVKLPESLKNDPGLSQGLIGANMIYCTGGLGRISYEVMTGISKSVVYATDQYSNTYCKGAKFTVIVAPHSMECIYSVNSTNNYVRALNTSVMAYGVDMATVLTGVKISPFLIGLDMSAGAGKKIKTYNGAEISAKAGAELRTKIVEITAKELAVLSESIAIVKRELDVANNTILSVKNTIAMSAEDLSLKNGGTAIKNFLVDIHA